MRWSSWASPRCLIGLTPTYDSIGVAAPVLLIVFRLCQGISFGAEFGTASTWVVEQAARSKYRAFWGAWVGFAIPIGLLLGFGSVIFVKSLMTPEDFTAWGWRIFFFIGFLVAIVGLVIRTRTMDSFVFEQHKAQITILKHPASQVWREMPWTILRTSLVNAMFGGAFFLYFVFGTGYMKAVGFTGNEPEYIGLIAAGFMLVFMIVGSFLADYINRRTDPFDRGRSSFLFSRCRISTSSIPAAFYWRRSRRSSASASCSASAMERFRPSIRRISRPAIAPQAQALAIKSHRSMAVA